MSDLTVTDLLLIRAADAGELTSRLSRGYEDGKPEGWPVLHYQGRAVEVDDEGRLSDMEQRGYLKWDEEGPVQVTAAGKEAIR